MKLVHLRGYDGDHPRPQEDFHSQRFDLMFKRNYINDDFHLPVAPGELGLLPSPQFRDSVYEFDVDTLTPYSIKNVYYVKVHVQKCKDASSERISPNCNQC